MRVDIILSFVFVFYSMLRYFYFDVPFRLPSDSGMLNAVNLAPSANGRNRNKKWPISQQRPFASRPLQYTHTHGTRHTNNTNMEFIIWLYSSFWNIHVTSKMTLKYYFCLTENDSNGRFIYVFIVRVLPFISHTLSAVFRWNEKRWFNVTNPLSGYGVLLFERDTQV